MPWNVDQIFRYAQFLIGKEQTGDFKPDHFFFAFNSEQKSFMGDLLGKFEARNNGKSGQNTGLIENETILSSLAPFIKKVTLTPSIAGSIDKPTDLIYRLAMRANNRKVTFVHKDQIYSVINSAIDPPSIPNNTYYYTEYDTIYTIWPASTSSVELDYVRDCRDCVWLFSPDANDLPVYDPASSVQPEFQTADLITITKRSIKQLGLHFADKNLEEYGQNAINTGN